MLLLVLYEDPPDQIPKIHVRSSKYMAWIAEMMLPSHLHVDKSKTIQFDQWRLAHLAEFGIYYFSETARTPAPDRKMNTTNTNNTSSTSSTSSTTPKTPAGKRRQARQREAAEKKAREEEKAAECERPSSDHDNAKKEEDTDSKIEDTDRKVEDTDRNGEKTEAASNGDTDTKHKGGTRCAENYSEKMEKTKNKNVESNKCSDPVQIDQTLDNNKTENSEEIIGHKIGDKGDNIPAPEKTDDAFLNGNSNSLFESSSETTNKETEEIPQEILQGIPKSSEDIKVSEINGEVFADTVATETKHSNGSKGDVTNGNIEHSVTNETSANIQNSDQKSFNCDICELSFFTLIELNLHKKVCYPDPDFLSSGMEDVIDTEFRKKNGAKINEKIVKFICSLCNEKFTNMVWLNKHKNKCQVEKLNSKKFQGENEEEIPKQNVKDVNNNIESKLTEQESASPEVPNKESVSLSESRSDSITKVVKAEADLDIPKDEVAAETNANCFDEVKNVDKNSENIVKNSAPPPLKQETVTSQGKERNKNEIFQANNKVLNKKPAVKQTTKKVVRDNKTFESTSTKCGENEKKNTDRNTESKQVLTKDSPKPAQNRTFAGELRLSWMLGWIVVFLYFYLYH